MVLYSSPDKFSNHSNNGGEDDDSINGIIDSIAVVLDDEAIDAASHAAREAYRQSSPQKSKARKLNKVHLPSPLNCCRASGHDTQ